MVRLHHIRFLTCGVCAWWSLPTGFWGEKGIFHLHLSLLLLPNPGLIFWRFGLIFWNYCWGYKLVGFDSLFVGCCLLVFVFLAVLCTVGTWVLDKGNPGHSVSFTVSDGLAALGLCTLGCLFSCMDLCWVLIETLGLALFFTWIPFFMIGPPGPVLLVEPKVRVAGFGLLKACWNWAWSFSISIELIFGSCSSPNIAKRDPLPGRFFVFLRWLPPSPYHILFVVSARLPLLLSCPLTGSICPSCPFVLPRSPWGLFLRRLAGSNYGPKGFSGVGVAVSFSGVLSSSKGSLSSFVTETIHSSSLWPYQPHSKHIA